MSQVTFKEGKCKQTSIRVKRWKTGYSFKCLANQFTQVTTPFSEDVLQKELKFVCSGCPKLSVQKNGEKSHE